MYKGNPETKILGSAALRPHDSECDPRSHLIVETPYRQDLTVTLLHQGGTAFWSQTWGAASGRRVLGCSDPAGGEPTAFSVWVLPAHLSVCCSRISLRKVFPYA